MKIKRQGGFQGGRRLQGGWLTAALGIATSLFGASRQKKQDKQNRKNFEAEQKAKDPYGPYRADAAARLNSLSMDDVSNTQEYKARQTAAQRLMAAQGYTGSGNAIVAAAEAGGASYQQAFDNLARQAGVDVAPGGGYNASAQAAAGQNSMNNYSDIANSLIYNVGQLGIFNKKAGGGT